MRAYLNLLPWELQRRFLIRKRLFQWSIVWACVSGAIGAVWYVCQQGVETQRRELFSVEQNAAPIRKMRSKNRIIKKRLSGLASRSSLLSELKSTRQSILLVGIVSRSASRIAGRLQVRSFELSRKSIAAPVSNKRGPRGKPKIQSASQVTERMAVTLNGIAVDDLAIAEFVNALRDSDSFETVELKSSVGLELVNVKVRQYVVECAY